MIEDVVNLQSADDVLRLLHDSPSQAQVKQCLEFFAQGHNFDIDAPGALQTQILTIWVAQILPDFFGAFEEAYSSNVLLRPLSSTQGLGAIVATLTRLNNERVKKNTKPDLHSIRVLLRSLDLILRDPSHAVRFSTKLGSSPSISPTQRDLLWKEYVSLTAGGKITTIAARYDKEELGPAQWLADGSAFAGWLGQAVGQLLLPVDRADGESNGKTLTTQLCARCLSFGYVDSFMANVVEVLCLESSNYDQFSQLYGSLKHYERRKFLDALLVLSAKRYLVNELTSKEGASAGSASKALRAFIALLEALIQAKEELLDTLREWLVDSQRSSNTPTTTLRAVVAVIASDQDMLENALSKVWETWANQLFVRHAPTAQQNSVTQVLLLTAGYVHRTAPMYLFTMARSSVNTHGVSNRLASSSPRARWLGMVVGMAISAIADKADKKLVFDTEDMQTDEAKWYSSLLRADDKAGDIQDLRGTAQEHLTVTHVQRQSKLHNVGTKRSPKTGRSVTTPATNASLEPSGIRIPDSLRIVELDDTDDLIPHAKPDSDPEDETLDATMVNRNKPKAPIYIRELIKYILDSENIEQRTLALQKAPSLIRRKQRHGKEVTDHLEELATVLAGLNDGDIFDLDDAEFARLRQRSLQAVLVTDAAKMGPWFAKAIFNVTADYSIAQRMGLLIAIGLGGRELAGYEDAKDDAVETTDLFPSKRLTGKMRDIWATEAEQGPKPKRLTPIGRAGLITNPSDAIVPSPVDRLVTDLERTMLEPLALDAADKISGPNVLKVRKFSSRMDVERSKAKPKANELSKIVGQAFFFPLTGYLSTGVQTRSSGGSASFNRYLLATYLRTLSLLLHSAGPSTPGFALLVAEFWELLLTLRSVATNDPPSLEALLFALLTILENNSDRQEGLVRDHAKELIETQEWARMILESVQSGGGGEEDKVQMLAAGVVVRCSEVVQKYQRRLLGDMVDM